MRPRCKLTAALLAGLALWQAAGAQPSRFKPGFNLFSKQQDIQLGKEAAGEIEKRAEVLTDPELNGYVRTVGARLAAQPQADDYPYTFKVVNDPTINAFALPGGPVYVHTGLLAAVENESQLAGVLAHEIAHVALRHGTNQVSKANLIQLPVLLASKAIGSGSLLSQLAQLGIGLGANSLLLKFSRTAETQADLLGVQIAAQAGYNPLEMARFFQKLESQGGQRIPQFLSDHPNPGNRMKAIENEVRFLPQRTYNADTGQLPRIKAIVARLPAPRKQFRRDAAAPSRGSSAPLSIPDSRPSGRMVSYRDQDFSVAHPDNWRPFTFPESRGVIIAPPSGLRDTGELEVGYGAIFNFYRPRQAGADLRRATQELIAALRSADPRLRTGNEAPRDLAVGGKRALLTRLYSESIFAGQTEVDWLLTLPHPEGIFYVVLVAPESESAYAKGAFDQMLGSLRLLF